MSCETQAQALIRRVRAGDGLENILNGRPAFREKGLADALMKDYVHFRPTRAKRSGRLSEEEADFIEDVLSRWDAATDAERVAVALRLDDLRKQKLLDEQLARRQLTAL